MSYVKPDQTHPLHFRLFLTLKFQWQMVPNTLQVLHNETLGEHSKLKILDGHMCVRQPV